LETVPRIDQLLDQHANPFKLAEQLDAFLLRLAAQAQREPVAAVGISETDPQGSRSFAGAAATVAFLHGSECDRRAHDLAATLGALSIKSPFTRAQLDFDVQFDVDRHSGPRILVNARARALLAEPYKRGLSPAEQGLWQLDRTVIDSELQFADRSLASDLHPMKELVYYQPTMLKVLAVCGKLLPGLDVYVSDRGNLRTISATAAA